MLFQTTAQFIALALVLLAGWFFGLATAPGGRRAKERLREAEAAHTANRVELERRATAAEARATEAERERERLAHAVPASTGTHAAASTAEPAATNGLFTPGHDDLSRIQGIDGTLESRLHDEGLRTYRHIEDLSTSDEAKLEDRLGLRSGTIGEQRWREQAAMLRDGRTTIRPTSSI